jgi:hypothetical protein
VQIDSSTRDRKEDAPAENPRVRELVGIRPAPFLFADSLRILLYFAAFCRAKLLKLFGIRALFWTLDQHIGVRIPGGQPINTRVPCNTNWKQSTVSPLCDQILRAQIEAASSSCWPADRYWRQF